MLVAAAVYLKGYNLDPSHVTDVLGIQPTYSQVRGGLKNGSQTILAKIGVWARKSTSESTDLSKRLDELLGVFKDDSPELGKIEGVEDAYCDVFVATESSCESWEIELGVNPEQLVKLARLGIRLKITMCYISEETLPFNPQS